MSPGRPNGWHFRRLACPRVDAASGAAQRGAGEVALRTPLDAAWPGGLLFAVYLTLAASDRERTKSRGVEPPHDGDAGDLGRCSATTSRSSLMRSSRASTRRRTTRAPPTSSWAPGAADQVAQRPGCADGHASIPATRHACCDRGRSPHPGMPEPCPRRHRCRVETEVIPQRRREVRRQYCPTTSMIRDLGCCGRLRRDGGGGRPGRGGGQQSDGPGPGMRAVEGGGNGQDSLGADQLGLLPP